MDILLERNKNDCQINNNNNYNIENLKNMINVANNTFRNLLFFYNCTSSLE